MTIIIPEWSPRKREPEAPVGEVRERAARAVADVMFERRKSRTLMARGASPERAEALAYTDAVLRSIREPSEMMVSSAANLLMCCEEDCAPLFQAMIDEAMR